MKTKRMNRLFNNNSRMVLLPLDHGVTLGPIKGLIDFPKTLEELSTYVDCVVMHKGMIASNYNLLCRPDLGLIMHLSANSDLSPKSNRKIIVASVEEALKWGCDGVSIHVNIGNEYDTDMLKDFAGISKECDNLGMPLLAMMYARGEEIDECCSVKNVKHVSRIAQELGADLVKVNYTGDMKGFKEVTEVCQIPILIAGGDVTSEEGLYQNIDGALSAGAKGVAIGRNVFQSDISKQLLMNIKSKVHSTC